MSPSEPIRILFYPHSARAFSSSLIGHLAELSREFSIVLLTECLHPSYARLLEDRALFPRLERIEIVRGLGYSLSQLLRNNRRWHRLARDLVLQVRPHVVVTENDMSSLFDMYLLRAAKENGANCLTIQGMLQRKDTEVQQFVELIHVASDGTGPGLKRALRCGFYRTRKWLGHFLVHYILPWSVGQRALTGRSSYVLRIGASGLRDSDLNLVPTHQAFRAHTASGVPEGKLAILPHPLARVPHKLYFPVPGDIANALALSRSKSVLVLLTSVQVGFHADDYALIDWSQRRQTRFEIIRLLHRIFPNWRLVLKPHPDCGSLEAVREYFVDVLNLLTILPPEIPVEPYLQYSDIILDLPLTLTTTLLTAAWAWPAKPIISANIDREFYGDYYRDYQEIDYVESMAQLTDLLMSIKAGTYSKRSLAKAQTQNMRKFTSTNAAVHHLLSATQ